MKAFPSHCVEIYCISFQSEPSERQHKNLGGKKIIVACTIFFFMTLKKSKLIVLRTLKKVEWKITAVFVPKVLPSKPLTSAY